MCEKNMYQFMHSSSEKLTTFAIENYVLTMFLEQYDMFSIANPTSRVTRSTETWHVGKKEGCALFKNERACYVHKRRLPGLFTASLASFSRSEPVYWPFNIKETSSV